VAVVELVLLVEPEQPVQQDQVVLVQLILLLAHRLHTQAVGEVVLELLCRLEVVERGAGVLVAVGLALAYQEQLILAAVVVGLATQQLEVKDQAAQV
jgi:hypothetical protein